MIRSEVLGCGAYLPDRIVTNDELARRLDKSDEWIVARTGIRERRIAAEGEMSSDLALRASEAALQSAGLSVYEVDLIVVAKATPDYTLHSPAHTVWARDR